MAYEKEKNYCKKWLPLLIKIDNDEELKARCKNFDVYLANEANTKLEEELQFEEFLKEAYDSNVVISNYQEVMKEDKKIFHPDDEFIASLTELEILACIAWLFREDHWINGSLISERFTDGSLLKYFKAFIK